ncbi:MAG: hypothetical protein K8F59_11405 [Rhodobacteraceae bacterium]|nr:hypothetical protein [Paracoccaceae bacterium]
MSRAGIADPEALAQERIKRINDTQALIETDRVPFIYSTRFWAAKMAGVTFEQQMYDLELAARITEQALDLLQPDGYSPFSLQTWGPTLEALDFRPMKWPGHGCDPNVSFQYLDKEYMSAKEYDEFLDDPTRFNLTKYLPRIAGAFEGIEHMPDFASASEFRFLAAMRGFANPEFRKSMQALMEAGEKAEAAIMLSGRFTARMRAKGMPAIAGGFCKSPFDHIADFLRGSKGAMLDMFRNRDKLLESIDKSQILLTRGVVAEAKASAERTGNPVANVFIPLHWGLDGFMSPDQFKTFYWPGLRKTLIELIEAGVTPTVLWEGNCTSRLELIGDIPKGKAVYAFEQTDLARAKAVLGGVVCLRGNVPASLLVTAGAAEVEEYCKNLIQTVGKGGGFILDGSASIPDESPVENVVAMVESVRRYGN